jgi:hypothetical protein
MTLDVEEDGFQIDTLARLPKTMVAFDASRNSEYATVPTVIPYDAFEMQTGGGMDLATGVFTAPIAGIYAFTGTWLENSITNYARIYIRKNGSVIGATFSSGADMNSIGITVLTTLAKGDTVDTYLDIGYVASCCSGQWIHFTGYLIYPM